MLKTIRHLIFLLVMAPSMVLAQQETAAPCSPVAIAHAAVASAVSHAIAVSIQEGQAIEIYDSRPGFSTEKRKTFEKAYKVSGSDMLAIENKFGKVHINVWNKNEIQVKVDMISRANTEQRAQDVLDRIGIKEARSGNTLSFKTDLQPMSNSGNGNRSIEINYTVYMPDTNPLTVNNSFGDVYLAAFKGKTDITVKHGSLKTDRLNNTSNTIKLTYSQGSCHINYINKGVIDVAYANLTLGGANEIQGASRYSDIRIGNVHNVLNLDLKYGSFKVDNVSKSIRTINLDGGFTPISLNFEDKSAFNFDVTVKYGDFKFDKSNVNITSLERDNTSAEYKGNFGSATPKGSVSIISKYDIVKFTK